MATGTFGTVRPADVELTDVEVIVYYTPSRTSTESPTITKLSGDQVLSKIENPNGNGIELMGGLYDLKIPTTIFNAIGIYNIYIRPAEIRTRIVDCGVLATSPNVKGLVFDLNEIPNNFVNKFQNGNLVGFRIEYLNGEGLKIPNLFRIVTSNNKCEPVNQNLTNSNQKAIRYRFNDSSSLVFCTLTPSSTSNVKPNAVPFIGNPNQDVIITNTYFNPLLLEVEIVEHDIETLAYALYGNQTKSLEDGIYTIYNFDNEIYRQYNLYEIKDEFTGKPLFEVKEQKLDIDFNKGFDDITNV
jgi:hypothetical protein